MRLLLLNHNVVGTGTFHRAFQLGRELSRAGHAVTLVTTRRAGRLRPVERAVEGVHVIEAPDLLSGGGRNGWDAWNALWRVRRLQPERYDVVHAFDCRPAVLLPALEHRRRTGQPLFMDWADWWGRGGTIVERSGWAVRTLFGPIETWFEEAFRTGATGNTCISEPLRQRCIALGAAEDRVLLLPNGCAEPAADAPARDVARARVRLPLDAPLLLHVGVMQTADAEFLFAAFRLLRMRLPAARLALVGGYRGTTPADLAEAVIATGYVGRDALVTWLAAADVAVVPLRDTTASRGRWPSKVNEYLSAGLPTVMPDVGGAAHVLRAANAGRVCAPDAAAFADALAHLLAAPDTRAVMRSNALALAAGPLSWRPIAQRLLDFYAGCGCASRAVEVAS